MSSQIEALSLDKPAKMSLCCFPFKGKNCLQWTHLSYQIWHYFTNRGRGERERGRERGKEREERERERDQTNLYLMLVGKSAGLVIERLRVRIPAGTAGEFSSPELTLCADSHSVSVPPPCYRSGT